MRTRCRLALSLLAAAALAPEITSGAPAERSARKSGSSGKATEKASVTAPAIAPKPPVAMLPESVVEASTLRAEPAVVAPLPLPREVTVREPHSIPIFWEGREIGRKVIPAGAKLLAESRSGNQLECRSGNQRFQVPAAITDVDEVSAQAVASVPSPAAEKTPTPATPTPATAVAAEVPSLPKQPEAAAAEAIPVSLTQYVASVLTFMDQTPTGMRFFHYSQMRRFRPDALRPFVLNQQLAQSLPADTRKFVRAAVTCYDLGQWVEFERSLNALGTAAKSNAAAQSTL